MAASLVVPALQEFPSANRTSTAVLVRLSVPLAIWCQAGIADSNPAASPLYGSTYAAAAEARDRRCWCR
jgi:hypothetical protein